MPIPPRYPIFQSRQLRTYLVILTSHCIYVIMDTNIDNEILHQCKLLQVIIIM